MDSRNSKKIAHMLLAGGKSRGQRIKAQRSAFKQVARRSHKVYNATMSPETKFIDTATTAALGTGVGFVLMNGMVQGTTQSTRIGNKVQCKGIEVRGALYLGSVNATVRVGVLVDFQPDGSAPAAADVWNATSVNVPFDHRNLNSIERYKVLKDELITIDAQGPGVQSFVWHLPSDVVTRYETGGNAGTIADIETGSVYFYYVCDQASGGPELYNVARYKFVDP